MAFVRTETWDSRYASVAKPASTAERPFPRISTLVETRINRSFAVCSTLLIHLFLLWLLLTKLTDEPGAPGPQAPPVRMLALFDVSEASQAPRATGREAPVAPIPASPPDVDLSAPSELPPPEWAIVRMPPEPTPPSVTQPVPIHAEPAPSETGAGQGAASAYDPYAGATPMRREEMTQRAGAAGSFDLDGEAFERLVRRLTERRGARGTAEFVVEVDPSGRIVGATLLGGTASEEVKAVVRDAIVGGILFRPHPAARQRQWVRLPTISLG